MQNKLKKSRNFRLSVSRSNKYLFAQIIDNKTGKSLQGLLDKTISGEQTKTEKARLFGKLFAQEALKKKIEKVVFDRGSCLYHGRVKAFAEGCREGGLKF